MGKFLICIDIFAWCWWLALGFFNSRKRKWLFAVEKSEEAFSTLEYNLINNKKHYEWPDNIPCKNFDINVFLDMYWEYLKSLRWKIDLIMGWPPCQGFSMAWKRRHDDTRNNLVHSYLEFVKLVQPKAVFFENVSWFTLSFKDPNKTNYSSYVIKELQNLWYNIQYKIVDFSQYWIPQKRRRFILTWFLKSHFEETPDFFCLLNERKKSFLREKWLRGKISVWEAISDLLEDNRQNWYLSPNWFYMWWYWEVKSNYQNLLRMWAPIYPDSHRFPKHTKTVKERFISIIQKRLSPLQIRETFWLKKNSIRLLLEDQPAPTLTTLPDDCIHYSEPRILTVREYARIQSFNDWFEFKWKYTTGWKRRVLEVPRYTQIWNAIPPLFWEISANVLYDIFKNNE